MTSSKSFCPVNGQLRRWGLVRGSFERAFPGKHLVRNGIGTEEFADLTGTSLPVVKVFFDTHAKGYRFEYGSGRMSVTVWGGLGLSGSCMLPCPPSGHRFSDQEARRENWWLLLGFVIGLRQGGVW